MNVRTRAEQAHTHLHETRNGFREGDAQRYA